MYKQLVVFLSAALVLVLAGCNPPASSIGTLQVNITGLPNGTNANVTLTKPDASTQTLTASATLPDLALGSYSVAAASVTVNGVVYGGTVTGSPATLQANTTTTVSVSYAAQGGALELTLEGLPAGSNGNVRVVGPNSFNQTVKASSTLSGLIPGDYIINGLEIPGSGDTANYLLIGYIDSVDGSTQATVSIGIGETVSKKVIYAPSRGALTLTVGNLPTGVNSDIVVTGPRNFSQTVTSTITLPRLTPGTYTITPRNVRQSLPIVDTLWLAPAATTVRIEDGVTATRTVGYTARGGTGFLWIPVADGVNGAVVGLSADQLASATAAGGTVTPAKSLSYTGGRGQSVVFDSSGNLYVISSFSNSIRRYTPEQLASSTPPTPVVLTSAALTAARRSAFDAQGNLWVANGAGVSAFTSQQLADGGSQAPTRNLTSSVLTGFVVSGVAFDPSGNLWVSRNVTANGSGLVRFSTQQVATGGDIAPADMLQIQSASFNEPGGLAFDSSGNLWVANFAGNNLLRFAPLQLSAGGSQTPSILLSGFDGPRGLAFDNGGNLWLTQAFGTVLQIAASGLTASGNPTPAKSLSGYGENNIAALAFSPTPPNLPINNK